MTMRPTLGRVSPRLLLHSQLGVACTTATSMLSEMIWAVSMVRRIYLAVTGDVNDHGLPTEAEWDWTSPGGSYPEGVSPYGAMAEAAVSVTIR